MSMSPGPGVVPSGTERPLARSRSRGSRGRGREGGAAAVEFALILVFLTPLVLGMLDYGKFMYVTMMATEAARMGARELARTPIGAACSGAAYTAAQNLEQGTAGAASVYMNQIGLGIGGASGGQWTSITAACTTGGGPPTYPTWAVTVQVDYQPTIGFLIKANLMPKGGGTTARARRSLSMRGH